LEEYQVSPPTDRRNGHELRFASLPRDDVVNKRRILVVDDHPLVREGLTNLIDQTSDLMVCGEAGDTKGALEAIARTRPDLAIIDLSLGGESGIDLIRSLRERFPSVPTIVLSMHDERVHGEGAILAGARGYVMKRESSTKVVEAIRQVLEGNTYLSRELTELFAQKFVSGSGSNGSLTNVLSARELEVFQLIGRGYETREIATALKVNIKTIQTYCTRIKEKLELSSGAELLREAMRWNDATLVR
jgi:DNA-binding NarL/FixJ family response regulator